MPDNCYCHTDLTDISAKSLPKISSCQFRWHYFLTIRPTKFLFSPIIISSLLNFITMERKNGLKYISGPPSISKTDIFLPIKLLLSLYQANHIKHGSSFEVRKAGGVPCSFHKLNLEIIVVRKENILNLQQGS